MGWGPDDAPYPDRFVVNPADGAEMVWVPAGTFPMGSQTADISDIRRLEKPELAGNAVWLWND